MLAAIMLILGIAESVGYVSAAVDDNLLRVSVVDLDGAPVHNAVVTVGEQSFFTDNRGMSPNIALGQLSNCYDSAVTEWGTVNLSVSKQGYTPAFVFHCVVYRSQMRTLTVRLYPLDDSELPYVCYVESPPDSYMRQLTK